MTLTPGTRLGAYEIVAPLGAGSMGQVYHARDARLQRDVAIKILPPELSGNAERLSRFEQEARAAAALNHPNILAIFDVGSAPLESTPGLSLHYLVTELLEGETLRARLERGPLHWRKAVEVSTEIAQGLAAAHTKGIVHRDVKPGNIFLTADGRVKVLDFGLAKLREPEGRDASGTAMTETDAGRTLGTVAYMSPEQAAGRPVDARSDLFAFGCVLYEMVGGSRPFQRTTPAETMAAILNSEPPELSNAPSTVRRLVTHCLEKDPDARFQSARDLAFDLRTTAESTVRDTPPTPARHNRRLAGLGIATGIAIGLGLAAVMWPARPASRPVIQTHLLPPADFQFFHDNGPSVAVSPEAQSVAFIARAPDGKRSLWVRLLGDPSARRLEGTEGADRPFWSPDGRSLGFFADRTLKRIEISGGGPREICQIDERPMGASWGTQDVIVFASLQKRVYQVPASGGTPTPLTEPDSSSFSVARQFPVFLEDGHHFVYFMPASDPKTRGIYAATLGSQTTRFILSTPDRAVPADGYLLFLQGNRLMAVRFDEKQMQVSGSAVLVADRVSTFSAAGGALAYLRDPLRQLVLFDRQGHEIAALPIFGDFLIPSLSHDGRRVAISQLQLESREDADIWIYDLSRHVGTPITYGSGNNVLPVWSPDDQRIAFTSDRRGTRDIYQTSSSGGGGQELLVGSALQEDVTSWSGDGQQLLFNTGGGTEGQDLWAFSFRDREARVLFKTPFREHAAQISPDGRWIAYRSDDTGQREIYVQSYSSGRKWRISTAGGVRPEWRRDNRELFYIATDTWKFMGVSVLSGDTFEAGVPYTLFDAGMIRAPYRVDVSDDGERFLVVRDVQETSGVVMTLIQNWQELLRSRK